MKAKRTREAALGRTRKHEKKEHQENEKERTGITNKRRRTRRSSRREKRKKGRKEKGLTIMQFRNSFASPLFPRTPAKQGSDTHYLGKTLLMNVLSPFTYFSLSPLLALSQPRRWSRLGDWGWRLLVRLRGVEGRLWGGRERGLAGVVVVV